jgi:hypothetical protein
MHMNSHLYFVSYPLTSTLQVILELIISANYRPFCVWERLFGFKIVNEGHEGIVGLISSFYVLNNIWPVVQKCP